MHTLEPLYGREHTLPEISAAIHRTVASWSPQRVGALHVTCADEAEIECARAFERGFVQFTLPALKSGLQAPFTLANLGARYEWGAARVAEDHFTEDVAGVRHPLLVAKINAHVGCEPGAPSASTARLGLRFGVRQRYGHDTTCCGMIAALLDGRHAPAATELRTLFASEGRDRLATILDERAVPRALRPLHAAIVSARLQARAALLDVQDHAASTPTSFFVLACVTLNRPGPDTEILCGSYSLDGATHEVVYRGLGDDPAAYAVAMDGDRLVVTDPQVGSARAGRDHRALVRAAFDRKHRGALQDAVGTSGFTALRDAVERDGLREPRTARSLLRSSLNLLAELAPVGAAGRLFGDGIVPIHHVFTVHDLDDTPAGRTKARRVLEDVAARLDEIPPEAAVSCLEGLASVVPAGR